MDCEESLVIEEYKNAQNVLPNCRNLSELQAGDFDPDAYPELDYLSALDMYLKELNAYSAALMNASRLRQYHFERFILNKRDEEKGHTHWRKGMNEIAEDTLEKLTYWSLIRETKFDEAVKFSDLMNSLISEKVEKRKEKRFVPSNPKCLNVDFCKTERKTQKIQMPKLSKAERERREKEEHILIEEKRKECEVFHNANDAHTRASIKITEKYEVPIEVYLKYVPTLITKLRKLTDFSEPFDGKTWLENVADFRRFCFQTFSERVQLKPVDIPKVTSLLVQIFDFVSKAEPFADRKIDDLCGSSIKKEFQDKILHSPLYSGCYFIACSCYMYPTGNNVPPQESDFTVIFLEDLRKAYILNPNLLSNTLLCDLLGVLFGNLAYCGILDFYIRAFIKRNPQIYGTAFLENPQFFFDELFSFGQIPNIKPENTDFLVAVFRMATAGRYLHMINELSLFLSCKTIEEYHPVYIVALKKNLLSDKYCKSGKRGRCLFCNHSLPKELFDKFVEKKKESLKLIDEYWKRKSSRNT